MKIERIAQWSFQIIPPLILLIFANKHGPGLWFTLGIPIICFFVSIVALIFKLLKNDKKPIKTIRPILTIIIAGAIITAAFASYYIAKEESEKIFVNIDKQCKLNGICPSVLKGWEELTRNKRYRKKVGIFIEYPVTYYYAGTSFRLHLYQSLDLGENYVGGAE